MDKTRQVIAEGKIKSNGRHTPWSTKKWGSHTGMNSQYAAVATEDDNPQPADCAAAPSDPISESYLKELFAIGDVNGDGTLQPTELAKLLSICGFDSSSPDILDLVAAADTNNDGLIGFDEFVPLAQELLEKKQIDAGTAIQTAQKAMGNVETDDELQDPTGLLLLLRKRDAHGVEAYNALLRAIGADCKAKDTQILQLQQERDALQARVAQLERERDAQPQEAPPAYREQTASNEHVVPASRAAPVMASAGEGQQEPGLYDLLTQAVGVLRPSQQTETALGEHHEQLTQAAAVTRQLATQAIEGRKHIHERLQQLMGELDDAFCEGSSCIPVAAADQLLQAK